MNVVSFASFSIFNGLVGGYFQSEALNPQRYHLPSVGIGGCFWIVDSCIKDRILEKSSKMLGLASIHDYPQEDRDKVAFIAIHIADFAVKAFISFGISYARGWVSKPISSAVLILAASTLAFNFFVSKLNELNESVKKYKEEQRDGMLSKLSQEGEKHVNDGSIKNTGVTFADVAGCDQAIVELQEIVDYLKNPQELADAGIKAPKGVLLFGPPGTGKTLLAKAIAGEAQCPFFYRAGPDFRAKWLGEGEKNVRNLFKDARAVAPCIIFIDELDSLAKNRSDNEGPGTREILNKFLTEMDGFNSTEGIIMIAATNRIDDLDNAFIRPGRFDRKIRVDLPDSKGRLDVLQAHAKKFVLDNDVDLENFAAADNSEGLSGADLECVLNEAALLARREKRLKITNQDIKEAFRRVVHGIDGRLVEMEPEEKRKSAIRQAGRAIVNLFLAHSSPIQKIKIDSNNRKASNSKENDREREIWKKQIPDELVFLMSARAAEDVFFGDISSSTGKDQSEARDLARRMINEFPDIEQESKFEGVMSLFSEEKVNASLKTAFDRAKELIEYHKPKMEEMVDALIEFGELEESDLLAIKEGRWNREMKKGGGLVASMDEALLYS